jgi:hypothetical protein
MVNARETKINFNTTALKDCKTQVIELLRATGCNFGDLNSFYKKKLVLRESQHLIPANTLAT